MKYQLNPEAIILSVFLMVTPALADAPRLTLQQSHNGITVSWPTNAAGFVLESTDDLTVPVSWLAWTSSVPTLDDSHFRVLLPPSESRQFFRLRQTAVVVSHFEEITDGLFSGVILAVNFQENGAYSFNPITRSGLAGFVTSPFSLPSQTAQELQAAAQVMHTWFDYLQALTTDDGENLLSLEDMQTAASMDGDSSSLSHGELVAVLILAGVTVTDPVPLFVYDFGVIQETDYIDAIRAAHLLRNGTESDDPVTKADLQHLQSNFSQAHSGGLRWATSVMVTYFFHLQSLTSGDVEDWLSIQDMQVASAKDGDPSNLTRADIVAVLTEAGLVVAN